MHPFMFTNSAQRELVSICTQRIRNCNVLSTFVVRNSSPKKGECTLFGLNFDHLIIFLPWGAEMSCVCMSVPKERASVQASKRN